MTLFEVPSIFTDVEESLFTRLQAIWFKFPHKCEQEGIRHILLIY